MHKITLALLLLIPALAFAAPKRIITIGGVVTDVVVALGHESEIVAVDATSIYPPSMKSKPQLGFFKKLNAEGILAQKPTIVIALDEAGPSTALDQIRGAGVQVVTISQPNTTAQTSETIRKIGVALQEQKKAEELVKTVEAKIQAVSATAKQKNLKLKVAFVYLRGSKVMMLAGKNTAIHNIISKLHCMPTGSHSEYIPLTAEGMIAMQPDAIIVTTEGTQSVGGLTAVKALPGIAATPAGMKGNIIEMDDALLLNMGSRTGIAMEALLNKLAAVKK